MSTTCRPKWAGNLVISIGEKLRLGLDFDRDGALDADTLTGTPTVAMVDAGSGVTPSSPSFSGVTVSAIFDLSGAGPFTAGSYDVKFQCSTTGGQILLWEATLVIEAVT